jgi:16S rRNA A1518/A1519 N6-dimethyltransferase RsmA/KsgA/DIM1 with predicted DNA glycosylase/AP lyase activity
VEPRREPHREVIEVGPGVGELAQADQDGAQVLQVVVAAVRLVAGSQQLTAQFAGGR